MKANETKVEDFLSGNKLKLVIPVYQRNYDWGITQCKQLLDDIIEAGEADDISGHFIGSIVYVHDDIYTSSNVKELTIIDGQQRLTTLMLIYMAIYKLAEELEMPSLKDEINETFLINKYTEEEDKFKLRPTENNYKILKRLYRDPEDAGISGVYSGMVENFAYFRERITETNYQVIGKGLSKLMFVEISLDKRNDDPQRIFESLNSTGLELSQADLIRNYILIGLNRENQSHIYENYWQIIESMAKDESSNLNKVSDFIRDYLTLKNRKIPKKGKVYNEFKERYPNLSFSEMEELLKEIKSLVKHYNKLLNPKNEPDMDIRQQLKDIDKLEINVAFPFLMKVYDDYDRKIIDKAIFLEVLDTIQSFVWRRFIVSLQTNALNKIFMNLYDKISEDDYVNSLQKTLLEKSGVQRFPKDGEVVEALKVKDVYNTKSKNKTYFLEKLENYNNNERVSIEGNPNITIEHIFPQNPSISWKKELTREDYEKMKEEYLNTIANLTLSGNNGKLGNKSFVEKRDLAEAGYKASRLWMNKYLAGVEAWNPEQLNKRFEVLKKRFLDIWSYPDVEISGDSDSSEVNIFEADDPTGKKLEYAIFFDKKMEMREITKLYKTVVSELFDLNSELFFTTSLGEKLKLVKKDKSEQLGSPLQISEVYFVESRMSSLEKFERIKFALSIFEAEDELMIKYTV